MVIQKEIQTIIKLIAKDNDISYSDAQEIIFSQFEYLKECMREGEKHKFETFPAVKMRFLGTFQPSSGKMKYMKEKGGKDEEYS